ncbi:MAG: sigma-54 dependent transcriptional regulator, partial [Bdellovibrionota bacterium]
IEEKKILGESEIMQTLVKTIVKVAQSDSNVLVTGETGTGKELIARKIHADSHRCDQTFIPVNCAAIPEYLLESELFGYRKGAFTGAVTDKMGLFEACDQGTIFLDEIGEIPYGLQAKLLRVLAEGKFIPLGSTQEKDVNVRVIAATHQNLQKRIEAGQFREDLYYRINVVELRVPALRERKEDIKLLADYFLQKSSKEYSKKIDGFSEAALDKLKSYDYPGNIRQLQHIIEQGIIFEESNLITSDNIKIHKISSPGQVERQEPYDLEKELESFEREIIQKALEHCQNNKTQAAQSLGITFRSLRYRLQKLGFEDG